MHRLNNIVKRLQLIESLGAPKQKIQQIIKNLSNQLDVKIEHTERDNPVGLATKLIELYARKENEIFKFLNGKTICINEAIPAFIIEALLENNSRICQIKNERNDIFTDSYIDNALRKYTNRYKIVDNIQELSALKFDALFFYAYRNLKSEIYVTPTDMLTTLIWPKLTIVAVVTETKEQIHTARLTKAIKYTLYVE